MVPFVILGFVIKPLNLKGIAFSSVCFLFHKQTILWETLTLTRGWVFVLIDQVRWAWPITQG
jgi:hypothetical protein